MSLSKGSDDSFIEKLFKEYSRLLREKPVLTKAVTSAISSGLGNFLSQVISGNHKVGGIQWRSVAAFSIFGFVITGPLTHNFYSWLDTAVPKTASYAGLKRIVIDRFVFAPPFLLLFFYIVAILEGQSSDAAIQKIREFYWGALKMNWRVWGIFQYINVNYVPQQYRVLFANLVSLGWNIYLAARRQ
ncbi:peroxisomal membrane protein 2 [Lingula anatina]|uniref:Peroxisomal membrane protein 2 n=1 Tax=Lingula anatina TaxID=7574 RepID=A0A1S3JFB4_LINAN|nr:peroxisomal membrane protein 2 [Lingula anatina]|eukprot:XP_013409105.1 peroxisomal membrane protein 2 [Lingula anatina]